MLRSELAEHCHNECPYLECVYCKDTITRGKIMAHLEICPEFNVECGYQQFGCNCTYVRRDEMEHMNEYANTHLELMTSAHTDLSKKVKKLESKMERMKRRHQRDYDALRERVEDLEMAMDVVSDDEYIEQQ